MYDNASQLTQLAERREAQGMQSMIMTTVNHQLRRFAEFGGNLNQESALFAAVRDLLTNLTLPNEPQQQMQNQVNISLFYIQFA